MRRYAREYAGWLKSRSEDRVPHAIFRYRFGIAAKSFGQRVSTRRKNERRVLTREVLSLTLCEGLEGSTHPSVPRACKTSSTPQTQGARS